MEYLSKYKEYGIDDLTRLLSEKIIFLWAGHPEALEDATQLLQEAIKNEIAGNKNEVSDLHQFIEGVLIHHQKNTVWQWFHDEQLGDKLREMLKPLYFVTARLLNTMAAKEVLLTQPPELNEPVEKIYQQIMERQRFYYGKAE